MKTTTSPKSNLSQHSCRTPNCKLCSHLLRQSTLPSSSRSSPGINKVKPKSKLSLSQLPFYQGQEPLANIRRRIREQQLPYWAQQRILPAGAPLEPVYQATDEYYREIKEELPEIYNPEAPSFTPGASLQVQPNPLPGNGVEAPTSCIGCNLRCVTDSQQWCLGCQLGCPHHLYQYVRREAPNIDPVAQGSGQTSDSRNRVGAPIRTPLRVRAEKLVIDRLIGIAKIASLQDPARIPAIQITRSQAIEIQRHIRHLGDPNKVRLLSIKEAELKRVAWKPRPEHQDLQYMRTLIQECQAISESFRKLPSLRLQVVPDPSRS